MRFFRVLLLDSHCLRLSCELLGVVANIITVDFLVIEVGSPTSLTLLEWILSLARGSALLQAFVRALRQLVKAMVIKCVARGAVGGFAALLVARGRFGEIQDAAAPREHPH